MKTEIKKIPQDFKDFLGGWVQIICLIIALLIIWYLTGLSIKYTLPVIVAFWALSKFAGIPQARKALARTLKIIVAVVFLHSVLTAIFPRIKQKEVILMATIEQKITPKMGDKVTVKAKDLWDMEKLNQSKKFLLYYNKLLAEGKPKMAYDTLRKFNEAWDMKVKVEKPDPDPIFFSETSTLQKGEQWFTDYRFKIGNSYKLTVEGAAVKYYTSNGSSIVQPGVYPDLPVSYQAGALSFEGIGNQTKVTVVYSR